MGDGYSVEIPVPEGTVPVTVNFDSKHPIGRATVSKNTEGDLVADMLLDDNPVLHMSLGHYPCTAMSIRADSTKEPTYGTIVGMALTPKHPKLDQPEWEVVDDDD